MKLKRYVGSNLGRVSRLLSSLFQLMLLQKCSGNEALYMPDYESEWTLLRSQDATKSNTEVQHGLGEVPVLIDVQVKTLEDPNKDFIFAAVGGSPRDDDMKEYYGGVIYIYNEDKVIISSPVMANNYATGSAIYTTNGTYYAGPNNQTGHDVLIKVRAWKEETLPAPDFSSAEVRIKAGSSNVNEVYIELDHGLGEYPGLVKVRAALQDGFKVGYRSDAVGASLGTINQIKTRYFVHGFNDQNVRVWMSSVFKGRIFEGGDGYEIPTKSSIALLEVYAWKTATVPALIWKDTRLGPNVVNENFEMPLVGTSTHMFVQAWAESLIGANAGYRFPGSGALVYADKSHDPVCTYGGLVYGYSQDMVRFWRPTDAVNGGIICISSLFGQNINTQLEVDAKVVVSVWSLEDKDSSSGGGGSDSGGDNGSGGGDGGDSGSENDNGGSESGGSSALGSPLQEWKNIENKCVHIKLK